jgi:hypothetical protein
MITTATTLPSEEFWSQERPGLEDLLMAEFGSGEERTRICGLDTVELTKARLPLLGTRVQDLDRRRKPDFIRDSIVVAVDIMRDETFTGLAFAPPQEVGEADPDSESPAGKSGVTFEIDLFEQLKLPRRKAVYIVTVLTRDQVSNRVRIEVIDDPGVYQDEVVARMRDEAEAGQPPSPPWPPKHHPLQMEAMPAITPPEKTGLLLSAERVTWISEDARCALGGAFRILAGPRHKVRRLVDLADPLKPPIGGALQAPKPDPFEGAQAVVPVTLVLTSADLPGPFATTLRVPSHDQGAELTGSFCVDLGRLPGIRKVERTYFVYAFCGEHFNGPRLAAFAVPGRS